MSAPSIHPTASIHPSAQIGQDVEIGPYCVVHEGVEIGDHCWLQNQVTLAGPTKIGKNNQFYAYCSIGQRTQDLKYQGEPTYLEIGDHNIFREFVTISRATSPGDKTCIGNQNAFLAYSHIAHDCRVGDHVIFSNNGTLAGHVTVEDYANIGGLAAVHQFCRIGKHAIVGGYSKVTQDVPPFMKVAGIPAETKGVNSIGLQRNLFSQEEIKQIKEAYKLLYRSDLNTSQALIEVKKKNDLLHSAHLQHLIDFVEKSERGITR